MVLRPDVVDRAIAEGRNRGGPAPLIYLSPRGRLLDQALLRILVDGPGAIVLCGRFEGVDQRVLEANEALEVSLGDFVLSGGEPAALALLDGVVRLLPGVVGKEESLVEESFAGGLLEYPHYTRPQSWKGRDVPDVLLSGHHERIRTWRRRQAEELTRQRRPDLWARYVAAARVNED
jgi:tRNA (guanine37-N1)-methyltransferase